jgi:hypothetical protein
MSSGVRHRKRGHQKDDGRLTEREGNLQRNEDKELGGYSYDLDPRDGLDTEHNYPIRNKK